jgi:hypothetical protein
MEVSGSLVVEKSGMMSTLTISLLVKMYKANVVTDLKCDFELLYNMKKYLILNL